MSAEQHSSSDVNTKVLITAVALGDLAGQAVTFLGGLANTTGWDVAKLPCDCAWAVLAFPLGWLGWIAGCFLSASSRMAGMRDACLWAGVTLNACLWGWTVYVLIKRVRGQGGRDGLDASAISLRIAEVRRSHVVAAHSRWKPPHAREALVAAASRAIRRCGYFFRGEPERWESPKEKHPRDEP
jgi:hypothetical protein